MAEIWKIELFGGLRARRCGEPVVITHFRTRQTGALLSYLAFHRDRVHTRELLCEQIWPDKPEKTQRNNLNIALNALRDQLEPSPLPARCVIVADRATVQIAAVTTDVAEFEAALDRAEKARGAAERARFLGEAVACHGGDLLPGRYDAWIVPEQERLRERFLDALGEWTLHLERTGEMARALECARRAVREDKYREAFHHTLIRILAATGRMAEALRRFEECKRDLARMGTAPSPELRALVRRLKREQMAADVPPQVAESVVEADVAPTTDPSLPAGTVTFLLTDVEGSTAVREQAGNAARDLLDRHHRLLGAEFARHGGRVLRETGDGFLVAFMEAHRALTCAVACRRALETTAWPEMGEAPKARMVLHTGDVEMRKGEYRGPVLHHTARMLDACHGGQILCSEATASLLRRELGAGVALRELGVYRLRDVPAPERLFQVCYPGMASDDCPSPTASPVHIAGLPPAFTRFFGREREIAALSEMLRPDAASAVRLITLTGPGGTGKTRLALEIAQRMFEPMRCAVCFVGLADLSEARLLPDTVRDALRLPRQPAPGSALEQIVETLSAQPALLVLDNFEHLLGRTNDPADNEGVLFVRALLGRVPALACLVTSRRRLDLSGEREFPVSPLPAPEPGHAPERVLGNESVQMFVDRARSARPDFRITGGNAWDVAELCAELEGIPLSIELAAARVGTLTPRQILDQLRNHRFDLLAGGKRDMAVRHRSVRATLDWSYNLLCPPLQRFFACLCVFRGGWTLEAGQGVCAASPISALNCLSELQGCSLITAQDTGEATRFRMLETLRQYGEERLVETGEVEAVRRRHCDFFLGLAEQAEPNLQGPDQMRWLDRLEAEQDNFRAALLWSAAEPDCREILLRLSGALWWLWYFRGYWNEGREWLRQALEQSAPVPSPWRERALTGAGNLALFQDDYTLAQSLFEDALLVAQALEDPKNLARSLGNLGRVAYVRGDYAAARRLHEESLDLHRKIGNRPGIAASTNNLGLVVMDQGDFTEARTLYEESLALEEELGNKGSIGISLDNLGLIARNQGDYAAARAFHERGLAIQQEMGNKYGVANALNNLGLVAMEQDDLDGARTLYEESLAIAESLGNREGIATSLDNLGLVARNQRDYVAARRFHERGLVIQRALGNKLGIANAVHNLGLVSLEQGDFVEARALCRESLSLEREMGSKLGIALALEQSAALAASEGRHPRSARRAARLLGAAEALRRSIAAPVPPAERAGIEGRTLQVSAVLGEAEFERERAAGAALGWEQAIALALGEDAV